MPWVNQERCAVCGTCIEECPVGAIAPGKNGKSEINGDLCIRCGTCHDVCPEEAVRHDSEKIPQEIAANLEKTNGLLKHFHTLEEQQDFIGRMIRYFTKDRKVAEKTIEKLEAIREDPVRGIRSAIESLDCLESDTSKGN
ncbi:MAG: 4Fe-4S binding protein [bacterium]